MMTGDPYKNSFNDWLINNALYLVLVIAGVLIIVVGILLVLNFCKKPKNSQKSIQKTEDFSVFVGGKENIISANLNGSRITLELKNYSLLDDQKLKENGVLSILKLSNKITLVCDKGDVSKIFNNLI